MTDEQREEIERLAVVAHDTSERHRLMGMMNTASDPEQARKDAAAYAVACAEAVEAEAALNSAIGRILQPRKEQTK